MFEAIQANNEDEMQDIIRGNHHCKNTLSLFLHWASFKGKHNLVTMLLDEGADINFIGPSGSTALYLASIGNHFEIVNLLLRRGASFFGEWKTIHRLVHRQRLDVFARLLMCHYQDEIDSQTMILGRTYLIDAAQRNDRGVIELLLEAGADPTIEDMYNKTAMSYMDDDSCRRIVKKWHRSYILHKARHMDDVKVAAANVQEIVVEHVTKNMNNDLFLTLCKFYA